MAGALPRCVRSHRQTGPTISSDAIDTTGGIGFAGTYDGALGGAASVCGMSWHADAASASAQATSVLRSIARSFHFVSPEVLILSSRMRNLDSSRALRRLESRGLREPSDMAADPQLISALQPQRIWDRCDALGRLSELEGGLTRVFLSAQQRPRTELSLPWTPRSGSDRPR